MSFLFSFFFNLTYSPMDLIITILPMVTKSLPISPRFTPYDFLSRCKFSTLTTRQPMVEEDKNTTKFNASPAIIL